jgi:hypothetical protein
MASLQRLLSKASSPQSEACSMSGLSASVDDVAPVDLAIVSATVRAR